MSDKQGRASIALCVPNSDPNEGYKCRDLAHGIPWDEARKIVLRLLGTQEYNLSVYLGEFYYFKPGNDATEESSYYFIFDPHPEVDPDGSYRRPAPERWVAPEAVQS